MSGFVVLYNRDGAPANTEIAGGMLQAIAHRGPDGHELRVLGNVALGHRHFWTTPEEMGERQPITDASGDLAIVLDGRIDNRRELLSALPQADAAGTGLSDAQLFLAAYHQWAEECAERVVGPFAAVIHDRRRERVICLRDPMGDRSLFYREDHRRFAAASEEAALLRYRKHTDDLDPSAVAHVFALRAPSRGSTLYAGVRELLPGYVMVADAEGVRLRPFWSVEADRRVTCRGDGEYADLFLSLLRESVHCRLRAVGPVGVLMSGGLDSTSVAALAAVELDGRSPPQRLVSSSYVFDELATCDERRYMEHVIERYGVDARRIAADGHWPLRNPRALSVDPNGPDTNPYRALTQALYAAAAEDGGRLALSGHGSDHMYADGHQWLADLVLEGRVGEAVRELVTATRMLGFREGFVPRALRRVVGMTIRPRPRRPCATAKAREWLTPEALALLPSNDPWPPSASDARRPLQHERLLGLLIGRGCSRETAHACRAGIEVRYPYRDRRLVELMLAVPAHQLFRRGRHKHILREAMRGILPEPVRTRRHATSILPLFTRGLADREAPTVRELLDAPDALWRRYVRADWLARHVPRAGVMPTDGPELVVVWLCISTELWRRAHLA